MLRPWSTASRLAFSGSSPVVQIGMGLIALSLGVACRLASFFFLPFCPAPARPPSKLPSLYPQLGTFSILPCYQKARSPGEAPWKSLSRFSLHPSCQHPDILGSQKGLHWLPHRMEAGLKRAPWPRRARGGSRAQVPGCKGSGCLGAASPAFRLPWPPFGRPVRRSLGHYLHHHHHHHV